MSTELTPTKITLTGITPAPAGVDDAGNYFTNTGRCFVHITGGGIGAIDIVINSQAKCNYGVDHDITITPVAATIYLVGPLPKSRFDDADGKVQIAPAAGANADGMLIQIIELP